MRLVRSECSRTFTEHPLAAASYEGISSGGLGQVLSIDFGSQHFLAAKLGEPMLFVCSLILSRLPLSQTPLSGRGFTATKRQFLFKLLLVLEHVFCQVFDVPPRLGSLIFQEVSNLISMEPVPRYFRERTA